MTRTALLLVRHEARLELRDLGLDRWSTAVGGNVMLVIVLCAVGHLFAWPVVAMLPKAAPATAAALATQGVFLLALFGLMLSTALTRAVETLFVRDDFDLLLASPSPPREILAARSMVVAGGVLAIYAVFTLPVLNMGLVSGRAWLAGGFVALPLLAVVATAAGFACALLLVRWLGARRTRTFAQVLALVIGIGGYLVFQLTTQFVADLKDPRGIWAALAPALAALGALMQGGRIELAVVAAIAAALAAFVWWRLDQQFLHGAQQLAAATTRRSPAATRRRFNTHPVAALCLKEWRCLLRDPLILSRLAISVVYFIPGFVLGYGPSGARPGSAAFAAACAVAGAGFLATLLAQLTLNMDDAPDLAYGGAVPLRTVLFAKALAAAAPAIAAGFLVLLPLFARNGADVVPAAPMVVLAAAIACLLCAANVRVTPRALFGKRAAAGTLDIHLVTLLLALVAGGAAAAAVMHVWWAAVMLAALSLAFPLRELARIRQISSPAQLWRVKS